MKVQASVKKVLGCLLFSQFSVHAMFGQLLLPPRHLGLNYSEAP